MKKGSSSQEVPDNESERLRELHSYDILDSSPNSSFDNLTSLAHKVLDVSVSMINLIDADRQYFLSETGLGVRAIDRAGGICNEVLLNEQVTTVNNLHDSSLFEGESLVEGGPDVRSYAGAPLKTDDGFILGTFCVYDNEPREFTVAELDILRSFARMAVEQIELRYGNEEYRRINRELEDEIRDLRRQLNEAKIEQEELLHRTKDSFLQAKSILRRWRGGNEDPDACSVLERAETKIHTFMTLYEQLHQSRTSETLAIKPYLEALVDNTRQVVEDRENQVEIDLDIESLDVNSEVAMKFGIALNELMSNVYQHVFLPGKGNSLEISFRSDGDDFHLTVRDDGPGISELGTMERDNRTGLTLVRDLIEHGAGSVNHEEKDGTTVKVTLPHEPAG